MKVFKRILLIFLAILVIGCALFVVLAKNYVNDNSISTGEIASSNDRVLFVFAHPDDEITVAGTLAKLKSKGSETGVIYLTRGEAGVTGGLVPKEKLGERRTEEAKSIQSILDIDYLKLFNFPDGAIQSVSPKEIKKNIKNGIDEFRPTVIVGFDETVGLYGHEDHRLAGLYLHQLLDSIPFNSVKDYYMVTLPQSMIDIALEISPIFRDRYPKDPKQGLPMADLAVTIWSHASKKRSVLAAHKTQKEIIENAQPYGLSVPSFVYFGIFDREYFHRVSLIK